MYIPGLKIILGSLWKVHIVHSVHFVQEQSKVGNNQRVFSLRNLDAHGFCKVGLFCLESR